VHGVEEQREAEVVVADDGGEGELRTAQRTPSLSLGRRFARAL
jgi:hypothetical protein